MRATSAEHRENEQSCRGVCKEAAVGLVDGSVEVLVWTLQAMFLDMSMGLLQCLLFCLNELLLVDPFLNQSHLFFFFQQIRWRPMDQAQQLQVDLDKVRAPKLSG